MARRRQEGELGRVHEGKINLSETDAAARRLMKLRGQKLRDIAVIDHLSIPPDAGKVTDALARIGYKLEEAVSDIADNALDASASNILVRLVHDGTDRKSVV